jgi:LPXTG-site transpeptidase (sortase) family protein
MNRLNIFLILLLVGMMAFLRIQNASAMNSVSEVAVVVPTATPTPAPLPVGIPLTIQIPSIGEDGPIVPTSTDSQGKMLMPESWYENAWYNGQDSTKPGEKGNAVIAGHLDTIFGTAGHFFNLMNIKVGDEVYVKDDLGQTHGFYVTDKQIYEYDKVPLDQVFGKTDAKNLNLITCTGWYNPAQHNYDHRLVVFTKLIE